MLICATKPPFYEPEFWHDTFLTWEMLFNLGWKDDNIYVLFDEGYDWDYEEENPWYTVGEHDYDIEPWYIDHITDYGAYLDDVEYIFDYLDGIMTEDDFLFVWTFDHGFFEDGHAYLQLEIITSAEVDCIRDDDFADKMPENYQTRVFWMAQCFGGEFRDDLEGNTTIVLAAGNDTVEPGCDDEHMDGDYPYVDDQEQELYNSIEWVHSEFNYHVLNAARGNTIYYRNPCLQPDTDEDGDIDMEEIFEWEEYKDVLGIPVYSDEGNIMSTTFIDIPPSAPSNLTLGTSAGGKVVLEWDFNNEEYDVAGYKIYRALQPEGYPPGDFEHIYTLNDPTDTDYIDYDFEPGAGNDGAAYKITAFDNRGHESDYSNTVSSHGEIVPQSEGELAGMLVIDESNFIASPNPFNPATTISFDLQNSGAVNLIVYDTKGREVAHLLDGYQTAGAHSVIFDGTDLASGIYFARLQAGEYVKTKKLLLIK